MYFTYSIKGFICYGFIGVDNLSFFLWYIFGARALATKVKLILKTMSKKERITFAHRKYGI